MANRIAVTALKIVAAIAFVTTLIPTAAQFFSR